jgi:hypothetical protein
VVPRSSWIEEPQHTDMRASGGKIAVFYRSLSDSPSAAYRSSPKEIPSADIHRTLPLSDVQILLMCEMVSAK